VAHTCNPSYLGGRHQEDHGLKSAWANSFWDLILKKTQHQKRAGGVVKVVECLPSKCEAQNSNPSTKKKKKKKKPQVAGAGAEGHP
jgi:hypothetical protein